jgi:hypothetical protein
MKKTEPEWLRATVFLWNRIDYFFIWYSRRIGFWDTPDLLARHHLDDHLIEPPADL